MILIQKWIWKAEALKWLARKVCPMEKQEQRIILLYLVRFRMQEKGWDQK